jgi:amino acid transporter
VSLKAFHIVFVCLSSLLAFGFAGWSYHYSSAREDSGYLLLALGSVACGVALIAYGFWFWRKIKTQDEDRRRRRKKIHPVPVVLALWLASHQVASACSVCYGDAEGPMIDAARMGVYLLFGLVLAMQIAFGGFFIYLRRRARQHD